MTESQNVDLQLNLTTQDDYLSSLAWLRQRITLGRLKSDLPSALRIAVQLPHGQAEVFLQTSNLYLIGFVGKGKKVYALKDDHDPADKVIKASGSLQPGEQIVVMNLYGDHGSLGTFSGDFTYSDLCLCSVLALYGEGQEYRNVRRAMSLLVCMLSEGARFLEVQNEFAGMGRIIGQRAPRPLPGGGVWGSKVKASEVVNYWSNATRARRVAESRGVGPTEGHQLAIVLISARDTIEGELARKGKTVNRAAIWSWIAGQPQAELTAFEVESSVKAALSAARQVSGRLKLTTGSAVAEFVGALSSEVAVKASLGLLLPALQ